MNPPQGSLSHAIKQPAFRSLAQEALLGLFTTTDVVKRAIFEQLDPHGITLQQYNVLRILKGAKDEGLPTLEIGDRMLERTPGVTRLVDRLVRKGYVRRARSKTDRRVVMCFLTPAGSEIVDSLDDPVTAANDEAMAPLSDPDLMNLISLLDQIRNRREA